MHTRRELSRLPAFLVFLALALASAAALAQPAPSQPAKHPQPGDMAGLRGGDRPWAKDVSLDDQEQARQLFLAGNKMLLQQFFKQAAENYRQALQHWDHPAIHYNLSLALMSLEQPLDLYITLGKALEHGVEPLITEANYKRAEEYRKLVGQQIAHVEIVSEQEGTQVSMDGKLLFIGPGKHAGPTLAGEHTVVATKEGYLTDSRQVVLSAGKHRRVNLRLFTVADLTIEQRRYSRWMPWSVASAGVVVAALGGVLHARAQSNYLDFDTQFDTLCADMGGCYEEQVPGELAGKLTSATWQQRAAFGAYTVGGAVVVTGLVLLYLNQPVTIRREKPVPKDEISLVPLLAPGAGGVAASWRF